MPLTTRPFLFLSSIRFFFFFFSVGSAAANERKYVQMRGPRRRAVVTIRIVINQPCARINRDVTTLFCRSFAFPLALSFPFSLIIRESRRLFRRDNDSLDTRRQANSKQRHLKKKQTEKFVLGHLSVTFFGLFKRPTRFFVHNKFYKRERIVEYRQEAILKEIENLSVR